jgi:hypothetical protein
MQKRVFHSVCLKCPIKVIDVLQYEKIQAINYILSQVNL